MMDCSALWNTTAMSDEDARTVASQPPSTYQKFAREVIIVGLATGLIALSGIFMMPLFTRTLGAAAYGIWAQSYATVNMLLILVGLGLPYAMTRILPSRTDRAVIRDDVNSVLCLSFVLTLIPSLIIFLFAPAIARSFFDGDTDVVKLTAVIVLLSSPITIYVTLFRALRHTKTYSVLLLIDAYGQVGVVAYLVLHGYGLVSMFLGLLAIRVFLLFCLFVYVARQFGFGRPHFLNTMEYLRFGMPTVSMSVSWWVVSFSDRYVIASYLGAASVGIYSAAYGIANIIVMTVTILSLVLTPALSQLYDEGRSDQLAAHIGYSLKYFMLLAIPFVAGAAVLARPLLTLFSTAEIASGGLVVLPLLALSILVFGVCAIVGQVLLLTRKTSLMGFLWVAAAALNLGLNIVSVPHLKLAGSAISSLIAYAFVLGIVSHHAFRDVRFPIDWRFIMKSLVASGLMAAVIAFMHPQTRLETVGTVGAGVVVYAIGLVLLRAIRKDEIAFFMGLLRSRSNPGIEE